VTLHIFCIPCVFSGHVKGDTFNLYIHCEKTKMMGIMFGLKHIMMSFLAIFIQCKHERSCRIAVRNILCFA